MVYAEALSQAWEAAGVLAASGAVAVRVAGDVYDVDFSERRILSRSCNAPTKDFLTILILHYLGAVRRGTFKPSGEWISFKEIPGGEIYYSAYRESSLKPVLRKYGAEPAALVRSAERLNGFRIEEGDAGIEISVFDGISVRVVLWKGDDEFGPEAAMLYDRAITQLFTMEDVVVMSRFVAGIL